MNRVKQQAGRRLKRHVRTVWEKRGLGFYGFVATATFLYLEVTDLAGDLAALPSLATLGLDGVIGWLVDNFIEAIFFSIQAALWPVEWIERFGITPTSGLLLAGAYGAFLLVRPAMLRLLEDDEIEPAPSPELPPG